MFIIIEKTVEINHARNEIWYYYYYLIMQSSLLHAYCDSNFEEPKGRQYQPWEQSQSFLPQLDNACLGTFLFLCQAISSACIFFPLAKSHFPLLKNQGGKASPPIPHARLHYCTCRLFDGAVLSLKTVAVVMVWLNLCFKHPFINSKKQRSISLFMNQP